MILILLKWLSTATELLRSTYQAAGLFLKNVLDAKEDALQQQKINAWMVMDTFFVYLYDLVQHRVMYQVIAFRLFRQILSLFSVTAPSPIQSTWAKVTPLN
ncbi:hypothetical protein GN958_ATG04318 [Phytophthora infestans]|uniref:Uncharacterized protein n=1 Tax=Phytophthora infestans TaxID=4787 RepID=A0A8S9UZR8_PHYIN|nr:hypothetical protein GN958_ATG04318 [Phytophthora infestans]